MPLFMDPPLNGGVFYLSQALAVVNHTTGGQPLDKPLLDTTDDQRMTITVGNNGADEITNVFVQYWVCAFSAGMASSLYLPTTNGMKGKQLDPGLTSNHSVPAGLNHVFEDPFNPTSAEVATLADPLDPDADFHACILANVYSGDPPPDGEPLTATATVPPTSDPDWNPAGNPHHAQRNIALVTPGTDGVRAMNFMMHLGNPDPDNDGRFELAIRETLVRRGRPGFGRIELDHLLRHPRIVQLERPAPLAARPARGALPALGIRLGDDLAPIRFASTRLRDLQIDDGERQGPRTRIELGADATRQIRLQASLPEADNALRIFDVVQSRDGRPVGGARVLFLNAPAEFRRPIRGKG